MEDKHTHIVRGLSKFLAGLITADLIVGLWVRSGAVMVNQSFFRFTVTNSFLNSWFVIDGVLLLLLVFYGWHIKLPVLKVHKPLLVIIGGLLFSVSVLHFLRLFYGIQVIIGTFVVPMWFSIVGSIVTGFLAYASFHFAAKK